MENKENAKKKANRLLNEKSPYLLQHAYNPVNWYQWGPEAFEKAKAEDKPVFVSIGYSSCHWCHVMEKECFEDVEVATLMNMAFVCVKVDREERPDLDAVYMAVCQTMGRNCGWPLNVLLTPDKSPFFVASYIPKNSRFGSVGMVDLVPQVMEIWRSRRVELELTGAEVKNRIASMEKRTSDGELQKEVLDDAYEKLVMDFDDENGGFGDAPKFPRPHLLLFLLRYWARSGEKNALAMVDKTLRHMRLSGIFDQVGFGFHRYSTDAQWLVPHFEKMLYDQALLTLAYTEAYQATGSGKFKLTAKETLEYALRDLVAPQGGFYSSEDADSEGEEGKFYLWTKQEVREAVQPEDVELASALFGVTAEGNYYDPTVRGRNTKNILHFPKPLDEIASEFNLTINELIMRLGKIRNALFEARKPRVAPARDDKILTDWNGLMIAALAKAGQVFSEPRYEKAAATAADFFLNHMQNSDGTLYHRFAKGEKAIDGFLDDYAFLSFGLIELFQTNFNPKYLIAAKTLTATMIERFWDKENGGFYFSADNPEDALPRLKQIYDGAVPSGNSVALLNLIRLAHLGNDPVYEALAAKMLRIFSEEISSLPTAYSFLLAGADFAFGPAYSVVVVGGLEETSTQEMLAALWKTYLPSLVVSLQEPTVQGSGYEQLQGKATAYVCRGQTCMPPTNDVAKMLNLLKVI